MRLTVTNTDSIASSVPVLTIPPHLKPPVPEDYPFDSLTEDQRKQVKNLRSQLPLILNELTGAPCPEESEFLSDECLVRYLKATKWQLDESVVRLQDTLQWRREFRPRENQWDDLKEICGIGWQYLNGFDKKGRPILTGVARLGGGMGNGKKYDDSIRYIFYLCEKAMMAMPKGVSQLCIVTEFSGSSMFNSYPISYSIKLLTIMERHYPEILGTVIIVNPSWYIPVLYNMLRPIADPATLAKVHFASSNGKQERKAEQGTGGWVNLLDIVDDNMLPVELGGSLNFVFDINEYWKAFMGGNSIREA
ncbi:hypothetical protein HDU79_002730 [Rhizoclosmatium sp. JEL0117]|nr:hypothetical protein HDU79_002730 [Rhizoclosmatium sp. JEL0117]